MKKILAIMLMLSILMTTGCGKKVELNLDKIKVDLENLKSEDFSYEAGLEVVLKIPNFEDVYETEKIGISYENCETFIYKVNSETKEEIIITKPIKGMEKDVDDILKKHFQSKKELKLASEEINGSIFYIYSDKANKYLKDIKDARGNIFSSLIEIPKADLETLMGVKESWIEESLVTTPALIVNSNLYMIVKPKKGNKDDVQKAMDKYMLNLEEQWKVYLQDQYELVKNRKVEKHGDYLVYIISTENDKVFDTIKIANK